MNPKESLSQRIAQYRQQIVDNQNAETARSENQQKIDAEKLRLAKIEEDKIKSQNKILTIENFKGTGIVEAFEEIRDKQLLTMSSHSWTDWEGFFRNKPVTRKSFTPAVIYYDVNTVGVTFDRHRWSGFGDEEAPDDTYSTFSVTKIDSNTFVFDRSGCCDPMDLINNKNLTTKGDAETMIDQIALTILKVRPLD